MSTLFVIKFVVLTFSSKGGIIGIALGKGIRIGRLLKIFAEICREGFTPREFHNVPLFGKLVFLRHGSTFKTRPLYKSLERHLGSNCFFGPLQSSSDGLGSRVAVLTTYDLGKRATLIASYNRRGEKGDVQDSIRGRKCDRGYIFRRTTDRDRELTMWEAVAATSATTPHFKPYYHEPPNVTFLDGALYRNNPVTRAESERRLLWQDVAKRMPHIFLSIGTEQDKGLIDQEIDSELGRRQSRHKYAPFPRKKPP